MIIGKVITFVIEYTHVGHIISLNLDDKNDLLKKRNILRGKINNLSLYKKLCMCVCV